MVLHTNLVRLKSENTLENTSLLYTNSLNSLQAKSLAEFSMVYNLLIDIIILNMNPIMVDLSITSIPNTKLE